MRWFSSLSQKSLAHAWLDIGKGCQWSFPTTPSTIWCTSSHASWGTLPIPQCTNLLIHCPQYTLPCWGKDWKIVEVMISFRYEGSCSASSLGKWIIRWVKNFFHILFPLGENYVECIGWSAIWAIEHVDMLGTLQLELGCGDAALLHPWLAYSIVPNASSTSAHLLILHLGKPSRSPHTLT